MKAKFFAFFLFYDIFIMYDKEGICMKKQSIIFVSIITLMIVLSVGYALFSNTITIQGTVTANARMDVEFTTAAVTTEVGSTNASALINSDKNVLTITVPSLEYPTSYAIVTVTVTNVGTIPVKLTGVRTSGFNNSDLNISYTNLDSYVDTTMNVNDTHTFTVKVEWDEDSQAQVQNANFNIYLDYEQVR